MLLMFVQQFATASLCYYNKIHYHVYLLTTVSLALNSEFLPVQLVYFVIWLNAKLAHLLAAAAGHQTLRNILNV